MDDIQLHAEINRRLKEALQSGKTPALSYDRVSTQEQAAGGVSLIDQNARAKEYADQKNLYLVHQFTAAESAFTEGRETFNKMIDIALQYGIQHVIFKNPDRLARNATDWTRCRALARSGRLVMHFYELAMVLDAHATPEAELLLNNTSSYAEYWSRKISYGVKSANKHIIKHGRPLGPPPIGYKFDRNQKKLVIDSNTRNIVDYIFDIYDNKKISVETLTKQLNECGYKTSTGRPWRTSTLHRILRNPIYAGLYFYDGIEYQGDYEPYITRARYEKRLKRMHIKYQGAKRRDFEFSLKNIVYTEFDRVLTGEIKKGRYVYYTHRKPYVSYTEDTIFDLIDKEIAAIEYSAGFAQTLKDTFRERITQKTKDTASQEALISKQISALEVKQKKVIQLFEDDEIDRAALKNRLSDITNEIKRLQDKKLSLMIDTNHIIDNVSIVIDYLRRLPEIYRESDRIQKGRILNGIAQRININPHEIEIVWNQEYQLLLNQEIMQFADTPLAVRKYPVMGG